MSDERTRGPKEWTMVEWLSEVVANYLEHCRVEFIRPCQEFEQAIRRRLQPPEVSREFVERWARKIDGDYGDFTTRADPTGDNLKAMLRAAGVTVKEEK